MSLFRKKGSSTSAFVIMGCLAFLPFTAHAEPTLREAMTELGRAVSQGSEQPDNLCARALGSTSVQQAVEKTTELLTGVESSILENRFLRGKLEGLTEMPAVRNKRPIRSKIDLVNNNLNFTREYFEPGERPRYVRGVTRRTSYMTSGSHNQSIEVVTRYGFPNDLLLPSEEDGSFGMSVRFLRFFDLNAVGSVHGFGTSRTTSRHNHRELGWGRIAVNVVEDISSRAPFINAAIFFNHKVQIIKEILKQSATRGRDFLAADDLVRVVSVIEATPASIQSALDQDRSTSALAAMLSEYTDELNDLKTAIISYYEARYGETFDTSFLDLLNTASTLEDEVAVALGIENVQTRFFELSRLIRSQSVSSDADAEAAQRMQSLSTGLRSLIDSFGKAAFPLEGDGASNVSGDRLLKAVLVEIALSSEQLGVRYASDSILRIIREQNALQVLGEPNVVSAINSNPQLQSSLLSSFDF